MSHPRSAVALLALLLVGCSDKSADSGAAATDDTPGTTEPEPSPYETDDDGDGVSEVDGDCDDTNPDILPGAEELCDGLDNDCNGVLDDGAGDMVTFYEDRDADGAGDTDLPVEACALPTGAAENGGDCDDLDASVHPRADEVCDGLDNDCDGDIDDDDATLDVSTQTVFFTDSDGDGYGDPDAPTAPACAAPSGTVDNNLDCDDTSDAVSPADAEVCDDEGIDENCNGLVNDDDPTIYVASQTLWYMDADADGFGDETDAGIRSCEDPTTATDAYSREATDCDDTEGVRYPGAPEVCEDGVVNDCAGTEDDALETCAWNGGYTLDDADGSIANASGDFFTVYGAAGDLDGDGIEDLVLGSFWSSEGDGQGRAYVFTGALSATAQTTTDGTVIEGDSSAAFGTDPRIQDVDSDGYDDLWVGAPGVDDGGSNAGAAYLLMGPLTAGTASEDAGLSVVGDDDNLDVGTAMHFAGDQTGDAVVDLMVGVSGAGGTAGEVWLYSGSLTGDQTPDDYFAYISSDESRTFLGETGTIAGGTDLTGDGQADVVIGAPNIELSGSDGVVGILEGPVSGHSILEDDATLVVNTGTGSGGFGERVHTGLDWNADGYEDLVVSAPSDEAVADTSGALFVVYGPITGETDTDTTVGLRINGAEDNLALGGFADWGDLDGDGETDLVLGSGRMENEGNSASAWNGNDAWVLLGPASGTLSSDDLDANIYEGEDGFGLGVVVLGDQDGDGRDELLVSDSGNDGWALFLTPTY